jgi:hypothetical protein
MGKDAVSRLEDSNHEAHSMTIVTIAQPSRTLIE